MIQIPEDVRLKALLKLQTKEKEVRLATSASTSLRAFTEQAWDTVEPSYKFVPNWHIDAMCEHLQAVSSHDIQNLLITIGPGHAKSLMVSVMWPCFEWVNNPKWRGIFSSYSYDLAVRDATRSKNLIESPWYQETFRPKWEMSKYQNTKANYENTEKGFRLCSSVGSRISGFRSDVLVVDDALNAKELASKAKLEECIFWWDQVMPSRLNDLRTGQKVIIMQRLAEDDLAGHVIEKGGFVHLNLPTEFEPDRKCITVWGTGHKKRTWEDPRKVAGELMFPQMFPESVVARLKIDMGENGFCTPGYTPILMGDWSERCIQDIKIGDEIIGYKFGNKKKKTELVKSIVTDVYTSSVPIEVVKLKFASGREAHCTADHKWFGRIRTPGNPEYISAKIGTRLHSVYTPLKKINPEQQRAYDWIGGMMDGEGSCVGRNPIIIAQSGANPEVQEGIRKTLDFLGFAHGFYGGPRKRGTMNPNWSDRGLFWLHGGRSTKIAILHHARMYKTDRIRNSLDLSMGSLTENVKNKKIETYKMDNKIVSIESLGKMIVHGLTTTSGNYVAWGFASQNSGQYQQRPVAAGGGLLKRYWWKYWKPRGVNFPTVKIRMADGKVVEQEAVDLPDRMDITVQGWDAAFKDKSTSDFVCGLAVGARGADRFVLDCEHARMDLPKTLDAVRRLSARVPTAQLKLVESKANGPAMVQSLRHEISGLVEVEPEGGKMSRAAALGPALESGNWYLPHPSLFPWVEELLNEVSNFPVGKNDDYVDALSMIAIRLLFHGIKRSKPKINTQSYLPTDPGGDRSWMS